MKVDIFNSGLKLPDTVYIVGTGPNGVPHYNRIPADGYVIVLNKAILIPRELEVHWKPSIWMMFANGYYRHEMPWFMKMLAEDRTPRLFGRYPANGLGLGDMCDCEYTFEYFPSYNAKDNENYGHKNEPPGLVCGTLRTGGTIAGAALQFAKWFGAKTAMLCGIDMHGQKHFDGQMYYRGKDMPAPGKDGDWPDLAILNQIICDCIYADMRIYSLSDTSLEVERG